MIVVRLFGSQGKAARKSGFFTSSARIAITHPDDGTLGGDGCWVMRFYAAGKSCPAAGAEQGSAFR
ncbi:hypothetical protein XCV2050 [Xanthomonas euvesicatoria pv. vesicatoria str. 85-10]|uniref:Uncharacterized protein n=1 Tax=Xanthomonas euvesicatoria pv. vesicatoria (strain 85-10) TaxID=316273 RepID=Q3BTY2_XANE5|nr:hypothetical protein XCV2050 [Xanthomonas euvesicatoria pv. vesicatoria str. 85-10]